MSPPIFQNEKRPLKMRSGIARFFSKLYLFPCRKSDDSIESLLPLYLKSDLLTSTNIPTNQPKLSLSDDKNSLQLYTTPPPSYTQSQITTSTIPQETWTNEQCVTWLVLILHETLKVDNAEACSMAKCFRGTGREFFARGLVAWKLLCGYQEGEWIYNHLVKVKGMEGGSVVGGLGKVVLRYQMYGGSGGDYL